MGREGVIEPACMRTWFAHVTLSFSATDGARRYLTLTSDGVAFASPFWPPPTEIVAVYAPWPSCSVM